MKTDKSKKQGPHWLEIIVGTPAEAEARIAKLGDYRKLRGQKMATKADLMDETGAALQFPSYFGENWDALSDCLRDVAKAHPKLRLLLLDAPLILKDSPEADRKTFWKVLRDADAGGLAVVAQVVPTAESAFTKQMAGWGVG